MREPDSLARTRRGCICAGRDARDAPIFLQYSLRVHHHATRAALFVVLASALGARVLASQDAARVAPPAAGDPSAQPATPPPSRELLRELTAQPRLAGTIGSRVGAEIVKRHLESAGWKVELDEREVLLSYPRSIEIELFESARDAAQTAQRPLAMRVEHFDPDAIPPGDVPKFNAWSASGSVRAPVIDAGFGTRADFERLKAAGVDLAGKIALVRYGRCYRGIKVDLATEFGCAAVLLFSDPSSDGPDKGATWPQGPWKPDDDAQRGSILGIAHVPGDPSTPGWPSPAPKSPDAKRARGEQLSDALPRIPCLPIGSAEARLLLERLATVKVKRKETRDGKSVEVEAHEKLGPGPAEVALALDMPRSMRTIVNVIARLPGASEDSVIAGAHRDAWVRGANDDGAGTVALLRAAQALGERAKQGWKPASSLMLCFWDAEEFGLIGSTEWGEANASWLREHALVYLNADTAVNGTRFSGAGGTPGMLGALKRVLERTPCAPRAEGEAPANLWQEWAASLRGDKDDKDPAREPELSLPGSGSDFAVFVHHVGVPSLEVGFGGSQGGQYHTTFDDFEFVERYIDPGFVGHELCGRLFADLLGEFADSAATTRTLVDPVEAARSLATIAGRERDKLTKTDEPLSRALNQVATALTIQADALAAADANARARFRFYPALQLARGLPARPWFTNDLWAPGLEDGYGSESFPSLRAAAKRGEKELAAELDALLTRIALARPAPSEVPAESGKAK